MNKILHAPSVPRSIDVSQRSRVNKPTVLRFYQTVRHQPWIQRRQAVFDHFAHVDQNALKRTLSIIEKERLFSKDEDDNQNIESTLHPIYTDKEVTRKISEKEIRRKIKSTKPPAPHLFSYQNNQTYAAKRDQAYYAFKLQRDFYNKYEHYRFTAVTVTLKQRFDNKYDSPFLTEEIAKSEAVKIMESINETVMSGGNANNSESIGGFFTLEGRGRNKRYHYHALLILPESFTSFNNIGWDLKLAKAIYDGSEWVHNEVEIKPVKSKLGWVEYCLKEGDQSLIENTFREPTFQPQFNVRAS